MSEENSTPSQEKGFNPKQFCSDVVMEMKKVTWANKREVITYTGAVGVAVVIVCALIWVCDTFFARLFHIILR